MTKENNKMQVDIENLFKQNVNDLLSIKELYKRIEELGEKITQVKYIDNKLVKKFKKEYENFKKIILDENLQVKLSNDIKTINSQMKTKAKDIVTLSDFIGTNNYEKLKNAILFCKNNNKTLYINNEIDILGYLNIECNIIGKSKINLTTNNIDISENVTIDGLTFDGKFNCGRVNVIGNNVKIINCIFTDFMSYDQKEGTKQLGIYKNVKNCIVKNCVFKNLKPKLTNNITGDENGMCQSIVVFGGTSNIIISNNIFKGIENTEDSDYIRVYGEPVTNTNFPYNYANVNIKYGITGVDITDNTFYSPTKSAVKIQGDSVIVRNNTLIIDKDCALGIRCHHSTNVKIIDNKIMYKDGLLINSPIMCDGSYNVLIKKNYVELYTTTTAAFKTLYKIISSDLIEIADNTLISHDSLSNFIQNCTNVSVSNEKISGQFLEFQGCTNIICKNIEFLHNNTSSTTPYIKLENNTNITIDNIKFSDSTRFILFSNGKYSNTNVKISNLYVTSNIETGSSILMVYDGTDSISNITIHNIPDLYNDSFNCGTTAKRPNAKFILRDGHKYFDTDLKKEIIYKNGKWIV